MGNSRKPEKELSIHFLGPSSLASVLYHLRNSVLDHRLLPDSAYDRAKESLLFLFTYLHHRTNCWCGGQRLAHSQVRRLFFAKSPQDVLLVRCGSFTFLSASPLY